MQRLFLIAATSMRALLILTFCFQLVSCGSQDKSKTIQVGPEAKTDLLIYFRSDATKQEIREFLDEHILVKTSDGKGFRHAEGVQTFGRIFPPVQGHEGIALGFFPDTPQEKKDAVKKVAEGSPVVYRILENKAPRDVKSLD